LITIKELGISGKLDNKIVEDIAKKITKLFDSKNTEKRDMAAVALGGLCLVISVFLNIKLNS